MVAIDPLEEKLGTGPAVTLITTLCLCGDLVIIQVIQAQSFNRQHRFNNELGRAISGNAVAGRRGQQQLESRRGMPWMF
jgi:hypothetical protein